MAEQSFGNYILHNVFGNTGAGTWNVLPAVLTTWSNLLANKGNQTTYELYREQARNYIDTAKKNAELIENQGAIAMRNLQYKNKLERGNDVVRIAGSNSNMSGTNLDIVVRKEKIRKMNEQTLNANYTNQAMIELSNGYRNAAQSYGTLAAKAGADRWSAIASILKGVETYVGLSVRDAKVQSKIENTEAKVDYTAEARTRHQNYEYGIDDSKGILLSGDGIDYTNEGIILNDARNTIASNIDIPIVG